jgi:hypothetical protein
LVFALQISPLNRVNSSKICFGGDDAAPQHGARQPRPTRAVSESVAQVIEMKKV